MTRKVNAREANQRFSNLLREVEAGEEIVVTRHGRPVARIVPAASGVRVLTPQQNAALARLRARFEKGWSLGGKAPSRDQIYDRHRGR